MKIEEMPEDIRPFIVPSPQGRMYYHCLECHSEHPIEELLYTCPHCKGVLLLEYQGDFSHEVPGSKLKQILEYRKLANIQSLKGIFRYYEFIAPILPLEHVLYLGEGNTPMVLANGALRDMAKREFFFKLDGLNPSASFKDRGMACALSYLNYLVNVKNINLLAICASTGDTSAAAALYCSYVRDRISCCVLLPKGKVTLQQLSQPLGHGSKVLELPGLFDDCMKVVEYLAEVYNVALLNSKNSWRILGQESFSYEIAQDFDWDMEKKVIVVPIGNAGNITAVLSGFLKFFKKGLIKSLPKIVGVQSEHADPVYRYYSLPKDKRRFEPVNVRPSVAQAAMIGNPVSMPRVIRLVEEYNLFSHKENVFVVNVKEQDIMDSMMMANRNGNVVCTQGGESLAGFLRAVGEGIVEEEEIGILDSTAHMLKFISFQDMYFQDSFDASFEIIPKKELQNAPYFVTTERFKERPDSSSRAEFVREIGEEIARILDLSPRR